ncbi:transposase, partial [Thermosipho melanesiensis]|uniref:transposase n=1 Tax=Thermosipho melanesiensis TaxID=46541 RepID=UPI00117DB741
CTEPKERDEIKNTPGSDKIFWGCFSLTKKGQKFKKYPSELKYQVVKLFIEENLPKKTIASLLGISPDRVRLWIKNYLLYGEAECKRGKPKKESFEEEMERLRAENAYLKLLMKKFLRKEIVKKLK